jgi:hypothetical protein
LARKDLRKRSDYELLRIAAGAPFRNQVFAALVAARQVVGSV